MSAYLQAIFLFFLCSFFIISSCEDIGSIEYPFTSLELISNDYSMHVQFISSNNDEPSISFGMSNINMNSIELSDILHLNGDQITLELILSSESSNISTSSSFSLNDNSLSNSLSFDQSSTSVSSSLFVSISLIPCSIVIILVSLISKNKLIFGIFIIFLLGNISYTQESQDIFYQITIHVPNDYEWKSIHISGASLIESNIDLNINNIDIDSCIDFSNSNVYLRGNFTSSMNICAEDNISIIGTINDNIQVQLESDNIDIDIINQYTGDINLFTDQLDITGGDYCDTNFQNSEIIMSCGSNSGFISALASTIHLILPDINIPISLSASPIKSDSSSNSLIASSLSVSLSNSNVPVTPSTSILTSNSASISFGNSVSPSVSVVVSPSSTHSNSLISNSFTASNDISISPTISNSNTPSLSESSSIGPSASPSPSVLESPSNLPSIRDSNTPSISESNIPSLSESFSIGPSASPSPSVLESPSNKPSISDSNTPTISKSNIPTISASSTPSAANPNDPCSQSWTEPQAVDIIPPSDPVSDTWINPGMIKLINNSSDWESTHWTNPPTVSNYDLDTIQIHERQWGPSSLTVYTKDNVISLASGVENTFSFNFWQNISNTENANGNYIVTFKVIDNLDENQIWKWYDDIPHGDCQVDCTVLFSGVMYNDTNVPTEKENALELSINFSVSHNGPVQLLLYIQLSGKPSNSAGNDYFFTSTTYERTDDNRSFSFPLISQSSNIVDVPIPPIISDPGQSNCPHLRTDLVDWHDPNIWPNQIVPNADGNDITIPNGLSVLISSCSLDSSGIYGTIYINEGSELIFGDANITLSVQNIHIDGGHLWIGSETCRLYSYITITLAHSDNYLPEPFGRKGITSTGNGIIDIHGKLYQRTWTRLASSVQVNDDRIVVMDDINWEVGQEIVIITSIWRDHLDPQNEVRTIVAIEGRKIQLNKALNYFHYAGEEYQSEVGLLSRRILIQGDEISETQVPHVGGHILSNGIIGRFSGVQTYRMGQTNILGKYPFHFHLMHESSESYFQDCSVYHSYYRCFTVHGTNSTRLSQNVAYDVLGHCYYLEDGVEENNLFEYNLATYPQPLVELDFYTNGFGQDGITIQQSEDLLIPADGAVSGFYISNANNRFYGNSASGGFTGYSFINFPRPIGVYRNDLSIVPESRPLAEFYGNTAHSSSYQWNRGACIYTGGNQEYDGFGNLIYNVGRNSRTTLNNDGSLSFMQFLQTRVYLCNRGLNHWGNTAEAIGFAAHDVTKGITLFGEAFLGDAVIEATSNNPLTNPPSPTRGFEFYDISVKTILDNVEFRNFYQTPGELDTFRNTYAIVSMTHSDAFKPQGISASRGISFNNVWNDGRLGNTIRDTGASRYYNIMDWDGSILDTNEFTILGSANNQTYIINDNSPDALLVKEWWNLGDNCTLHPEYVMYSCTKQINQEIVNIFLDVHMLTNDVTLWRNTWGEQPPGVNVGTVSQFGYTGDDTRNTIITINPGITGVSGDSGWYFNLDNGTPHEYFLRTRQIPLVNGINKYLITAMKYPKNIVFDISTEDAWVSGLDDNVTLASSFSEMYNDPDGLKYWLLDSPTANEQWLFMKIINRHFNGREEHGYFERRGIKLYDLSSAYWYRIASCTTLNGEGKCPTYPSDGILPYWTVEDDIPPFVSTLLS